jgi:hypothetical protein
MLPSIPVSDIENPENVQKVELLNHVLAGKAANRKLMPLNSYRNISTKNHNHNQKL